MFACAPGVRLHVGVLGAEQGLRPGDRQRLDDVDLLAAAVVAPARVALGVLVREDRTGRFEDGAADEVLRGDQLEPVRLARGFRTDGGGHVGIDLGERALHQGPGGLCRHSRFSSSRTSRPQPCARPSRAPSRSRSITCWTRRACRPPSNGVASQSRDDLVGEPGRHDAAADREDVGVVVGAREPRRVEVVAERRADAGHLVGGDLLALPAAADDDAALGAARDDGPADGGADRRIVHRLFGVRCRGPRPRAPAAAAPAAGAA